MDLHAHIDLHVLQDSQRKYGPPLKMPEHKIHKDITVFQYFIHIGDFREKVKAERQNNDASRRRNVILKISTTCSR
jgi:hypothetical protein